MIEIAWLKLGHILGLVYWLGGDLGVFYTSFYVANATVAAPVRITLAKILFALDMAPRVCMILMLPLGAHLGFKLGMLPISMTAVVLLWALAVAWLVLAFVLHAKGPRAGLLIHVDWVLRLSVIAALIVAGIYGRTQNTIPDFLTLKLFIFAGLITCGLLIRVQLKPFGPAFGALVSGQGTAEDDTVISKSLARSRPFVLLIWIGLLTSAALGLHAL